MLDIIMRTLKILEPCYYWYRLSNRFFRYRTDTLPFSIFRDLCGDIDDRLLLVQLDPLDRG